MVENSARKSLPRSVVSSLFAELQVRVAPGLNVTPRLSCGTWLSQEQALHVREEMWGHRGVLFAAQRSHVGGRAGVAAERGVGGARLLRGAGAGGVRWIGIEVFLGVGDVTKRGCGVIVYT